jgi:restriction system protein
VPPSAVRDLFGVVHAEGATKGILITTSGFGPSSHDFANGKPLQLYDGTRLLWLCHEQGIDARIVMPPKTKKGK